MKRSFLILIILVGVIAAPTGAGAAGADISKAEKNLERESKRLNDTAAKADGEKAVVKRLVIELKTTEPQIQALRDRKLSYGEIAVILSLAQKMPGGVTDDNVQKVVGMRQGPPVAGWGQVALQSRVRLETTVSQIRKLTNNANREIKNEHARTGKAPKKAQPEQPQEKKEPVPPDTFKGEGKSLNRGGSAM